MQHDGQKLLGFGHPWRTENPRVGGSIPPLGTIIVSNELGPFSSISQGCLV
jgi:hypothetical protein